MIGETAQLAVELKLKDQQFQSSITKDEAGLRKLNTTVGKTGGAFSAVAKNIGGFQKNMGSAFSNVGKGAATAAHNITLLGLAAGALLASQVKFGIDALKRLDDVQAQTAAGLKSTKFASGQTAESIRALAEEYESLNATIDDKVIQSAENLLLTFPKITKQAFEPTLKAALNLNTALGGGEGGLQGTIIQVGKALQDPIRGLTSLRRVGVAFSKDQEAQIKKLVKQNDLYGAQQIILKELEGEFGGRFAAAGNTATGKFAKLSDAIEDLQMNLATALLPVLSDVATELDGFLRDPASKQAVANFGKDLAAGFKEAVKWAKSMDWKGIRSGLQAAAGFAKGLIGAFLSAPQWLQTAVITGWGLNKLTGGAVQNIMADLTKAVIGGALQQFVQRGATPANPLFVADVAGGLGGAGALGASSKWVKVGNIIGLAIGAASILAVAQIAEEIHKAITPFGGLEGRLNAGKPLPADQLSWPWGPKNTPKWDLGPLKNILGGDSTFTTGGLVGNLGRPGPMPRAVLEDAVAKGTERGLIHSGVFKKAEAVREAGGFRTSREALIADLHSKKPLGVDALVTGQAIALAVGNHLRTDQNPDLKSAAYNLKLLKRLQDHLPADLASQLGPKIHSLEVTLQAAIDRTTAAVKAVQINSFTGFNVTPGKNWKPDSAPRKPVLLPGDSRSEGRIHAAGFLGLTTGRSDLGIAGEAGTEAVAIVKNPKRLAAGVTKVSVTNWPSGFGSGGSGGAAPAAVAAAKTAKTKAQTEAEQTLAAIKAIKERAIAAGHRGTDEKNRKTLASDIKRGISMDDILHRKPMVIHAKVTSSIKDTADAIIVRGRWGKTAAQAGGA